MLVCLSGRYRDGAVIEGCVKHLAPKGNAHARKLKVIAACAGEPAHVVAHELNEAIYVADRVIGLSQSWNWAAGKHAESPGATVVYDAVAPVYAPGAEVNFQDFAQQRREIRQRVFSDDLTIEPSESVRFWRECAAGCGQGVMAP